MSVPRIVAMGGGGFLMEPRNPRLDSWIVSLARKRRRRRVLLAYRVDRSAEHALTTRRL